MSDPDFILKGPPVGPIPDCSIAEYLLPKLRSHPQDQIIQVEGDTGAEQTVGEFLAMSIRLSEGLKKLGLKENDVVGMLCRNCFEASEIVLATWLSGAAITPSNGKMKVAEMKHFLELTKPKFLFCDEEAIENATEALKQSSASSRVIFVGNTKKCHESFMAFQEVLIEADVKNYKPRPVKSPSTQEVAFVMSSGTSGLPKAVAITHKNFIFQDLNMETLYPLNQGMIILQISNFYWITAFLIFLKSLTKCRKRVVLRDVTVENVLKAIEKYKTEWTLMAPLFAFSIIKSTEFEKYDVSSMKIILLGGSALTKSIGRSLMEKWKNVKLMQAYGITEISGAITSTCENGYLYSVGKLTAGVHLKVVDENTGKPLKANDLGEILVTSPGLMKGYLRNEEATREILDSEGWLHTGDLGYYDESGQLYIVDRIKELVKIMNMQIAPVEIENEILNVPGVREVGVVGVTNDGNFYELLALIVKEKNSNVKEEDIHAYTANTLSDYKKITGGIYFVDSLPKTGSEKLQRKEIRRMAQTLYSNACKKKLEI